MRYPGLVVTLLLLCIVTPGAQQPPSITFQVEVNYVDVDVVVTDAEGHPVGGLTRDDFDVLEDGKPQKVEMFSYVELPVTPPDRFVVSGRPVSSDARSNRRAFDGRVYVIVLDDLDISPLRTGIVKRFARDFVNNRLGSNDIASVVYTSGRSDATQDFTSDRQLLLNAIDKFVGRRLQPAAVELLEKFYFRELSKGLGDRDYELSPDPNASIADASRPVDIRDSERAYRATAVLDTMRNLGEFLSGVRGRRKAVLFFSEGLELPMAELYSIHTSTEIVGAIKDAITAAARSNVSFFALDPRGLIGLTTEYIELAQSGAPEVANGAFGALNAQQGLLADMRGTQDTLKVLSEETGGFAAVNMNDLNAAFDRIVEVNSRYYVLGYYPPTHPRDGRFHSIEVRVKRPGVRVTARKGYASPRGRTPAERRKDEETQRRREARRSNAANISSELRTVLDAPMQQSGLTFSVQAAPFRDTPAAASVALAIELNGDALEFADQAGTFANRLELCFFAINQDGKSQKVTRSEYNLTLKPDTHARVKTGGLRMNLRMSLSPGRYQVRVGTRESVAGRSGSVFYDIDVPDFRKDPLMMSGLLLTAPSVETALTAQPDVSPVTKLLPGPPTSQRTFRPSDTISVLAEIYDNLPDKQARQIDTRVVLISENGQEVFSARDVVPNGPGTAGGSKPWSAYGFLKDVPLKGIPAGRYLLRVEAKVRGNTTPAARETLVTVQ
jgi:VWFA-related protein